MEKLMLQFYSDRPPSLADVRREFNLDADEIDANFGVIASDPADRLYTVLIAGESAARVEKVLAARAKREGEGVYSNPRIEPFGLPQM
jgi:hypothetical protein